MAPVRARPVYEEDCEQLGAAKVRENMNTKPHPSGSEPTPKHIAYRPRTEWMIECRDKSCHVMSKHAERWRRLVMGTSDTVGNGETPGEAVQR
jgi:hypothetical protein